MLSNQACLLTIASCNRRAGIAVVAESFSTHHPGAQIFICLVDRPGPEAPPLDLPGKFFFADELSLPGGQRFLFQYEAFELCCALKPYAITHVMQQYGVDHLLYLDSDILVLQSFWDDLALPWQSHSLLLTPHLTRLPIGLPMEFQRSLVQHGAYNGGFVAVKLDSDAKQILQCWAAVLATGCTFDPMNSIYVDQRWLDLLTSASAAFGILRDPGLNVAYWNLHERVLERNAAGMWTANNQPLKFFHFSGFNRDRLTTKMTCTDPNALALARDYGKLLDEAGESKFARLPYGWASYCDGSPIPVSHRDLILSNHPELRDVSEPFVLPTNVTKWKTMQLLAQESVPARIGQRYRDRERAADLLRQAQCHPVLGLAWKLWCRFINPSRRAKLPPYAQP